MSRCEEVLRGLQTLALASRGCSDITGVVVSIQTQYIMYKQVNVIEYSKQKPFFIYINLYKVPYTVVFPIW